MRKLINKTLLEVHLRGMAEETGLGRQVCKDLHRRDGGNDVSCRVYCASYVWLVINRIKKSKPCIGWVGKFSVPMVYANRLGMILGDDSEWTAIKVKRGYGSILSYKRSGIRTKMVPEELDEMSIELYERGLYFRRSEIKRLKIGLNTRKNVRRSDGIPKFVLDRYGALKCRELIIANWELIKNGVAFDFMCWGEELEVLKCRENEGYAIRYKHGCIYFKGWESPKFYAFQDYWGNLWKDPPKEDQEIIEKMISIITRQNQPTRYIKD